MKRVMILSVIFLVFFIQIISAAPNVIVKNYSLTTSYSPDAPITGQINLNLSGISANAYFSSSFGQNISLIDLIEKQWTKSNYSCTTSDCNSSYITTDSADTEDINLVANEPQVFGFLVDGQGSISLPPESRFNLNVTGDAPASFLQQLSIDLLNDNSPEWVSYKPLGVLGGELYGCYKSEDYVGDNVTIDTTGVCEKVFLQASPDLVIGAVLDLDSVGTTKMQMTIKDKDNIYPSGVCKTDASSSGKIKCIPQINGINYSIKQSGDFFVCINKVSGTGSFEIRTENVSSCGFYGRPPPVNYGIDYEVFAAPDRFDATGSFFLNDTETSKSWYQLSNLESKISGYLTAKYGNDCSNGCVIPISFKGKIDQALSLSNFELKVKTDSGIHTFNKISNVEETTAFISTNGYQNLSLNFANFSVPSDFGNKTFKLTLIDGNNSYNILSKTIHVESIPQIVSVTPDLVAGASPTEFTVNLNALGVNITQYKWDFGDKSSIQTTITNKVSHTYNELKIYNLTIIITNSQGFSSSATFPINVIAPKEAVTSTLSKDLESITNIEAQFVSYPKFTQDAIKQILNLDAVNTQLQTLSSSAAAATTDQQYLNVMKDLIKINLPDSIQQTSSAAAAPFLPVGSKINLDILKAIGGGDYDPAKSGQYTDAIVSWDLNNVKLTLIDHSEFSGIYGNRVTPIIDIVTINLAGVSKGNAYLVIPKLDNIFLDQNYSQSGDYYYVPLSSNSATVQFATSESLSPIDLPIFIAPSLTQISLPGEETGGNKMVIFFIVMGAVIFVGLLAYIIVGKWYQKKYESFLFKDKNDLYNIINYIHSLKSRGVKGNDIEKNLEKAKWSAEQIKYVMKRYAGKKVGIPGFLRRPKAQ